MTNFKENMSKLYEKMSEKAKKSKKWSNRIWAGFAVLGFGGIATIVLMPSLGIILPLSAYGLGCVGIGFSAAWSARAFKDESFISTHEDMEKNEIKTQEQMQEFAVKYAKIDLAVTSIGELSKKEISKDNAGEVRLQLRGANKDLRRKWRYSFTIEQRYRAVKRFEEEAGKRPLLRTGEAMKIMRRYYREEGKNLKTHKRAVLNALKIYERNSMKVFDEKLERANVN